MKADKYESKIAADKTLKETPISRRGLFAALAVAAGLGLLGADDAFGWDYVGPKRRYWTGILGRIRHAKQPCWQE